MIQRIVFEPYQTIGQMNRDRSVLIYKQMSMTHRRVVGWWNRVDLKIFHAFENLLELLSLKIAQSHVLNDNELEQTHHASTSLPNQILSSFQEFKKPHEILAK